jgi:thioredoxin reductase (NADPH)
MNSETLRDVIIVGGGLAGLSAAIYLGRARRRTLVVDAGKSLAAWEPQVQNYLGFPQAIPGEELLERGRLQAREYQVEFATDTIESAERQNGTFKLKGEKGRYEARRVLLATGLFHLPPEISGVDECLGRSIFFCKDCDGWRVQKRDIAIVGRRNEAVEYALAMLSYSSCVLVATNGRPAAWDEIHAGWLEEYKIPVYHQRITQIEHQSGNLLSIQFEDGQALRLDCMFTTRGDIFHNQLARMLGAELDEEGQVLVDSEGETCIPGLYAAGCVTPANCQMIIAAGEGAKAAQAINRDLFIESLKNHSLLRQRQTQLRCEKTIPAQR